MATQSPMVVADIAIVLLVGPRRPLDKVEAAQLAVGFTALADPVRLRVLSILAAAPTGEVCVCDFVAPLGKSQKARTGRQIRLHPKCSGPKIVGSHNAVGRRPNSNHQVQLVRVS